MMLNTVPYFCFLCFVTFGYGFFIKIKLRGEDNQQECFEIFFIRRIKSRGFFFYFLVKILLAFIVR
jgi:hypothetical protein